MDYQERLERVIPGGAHTYSRGKDQFPANAPQILERGQGAYVWDNKGKSYLDYGMGLRAVTLGYAYPEVNQAAIAEIEKGNNLTRASLTELKAAEEMVDLIPSFDMVKFSKNGSNATSAAVKLARAYTGRKYICVPKQQPFFSFDDWFIGTTVMNRGVPKECLKLTLTFDYGDIQSLKQLFLDYPGEIAAVMMEPATTILPYYGETAKQELFYREEVPPNEAENFLTDVQSLCRAQGALFILDEMITGFRWHLQGAGTYFNVQPDLSTFGKGMANGFSVAAVGGRRDIMELGAINLPGLERTFLLSTTHGGEMSSLGALLETIKIYKQNQVCEHLWKYGKRLKDGILNIVAGYDLQSYFHIDGPPISMNYLTKDDNGVSSLGFRTLFNQEMIKQGVMMPWIAPSFSHKEKELEKTLAAIEQALYTYKAALEHGLERYLNSSAIKPVFRKFN